MTMDADGSLPAVILLNVGGEMSPNDVAGIGVGLPRAFGDVTFGNC
jgi:hypothetical protein